MSKIIGDEKIISAAKAVPAGHPSSFINWDEIERIPELYDVRIVPVQYKAPTKSDPGDFEPVGNTGTYMIASDLANKISEARGIIGLDMGEPIPIYQEIDWNRMTCQFDKPPMMVRYPIGYTSIKQGKVLKSDGTSDPCDSCVVSYNAWERVCADKFSDEEIATDYYNPAKIKAYPDGRKYYEYTFYDKTEGQQKTAKKNIMYDTRAKRQSAFDDEMKFAQRKADTKARNLVVRVVCGMPTGYTADQLKGGVFYFYRVVRSEFAIKSEHAARLTAYSHGIADTSASRALFQSTPSTSEVKYEQVAARSEPRNVTPPEPPAPTPESMPLTPLPTVSELAREAAPAPAVHAPADDQRAELIRVLTVYQDTRLIPADQANTAKKILAWLNTEKKATENAVYWPKALGVLAAIEATVPEAMRISQGIKR
jgi:hypothetical protein